MKKNQFKTTVAAAIVGLLSPLALMMPSASAVSVTWTGATNQKLNTAANWTGGAIPTALDKAEFGIIGGPQMLDNDVVGFAVQSLVFNGANPGISSTSYSISGNGITLSSGIDAIMTGSGGDHAVKTSVTLSGNSVFKTSGSNSLEVGAEGKMINLGANSLTLKPDGGTITLAGEVVGSGGITVNGSGGVQYLGDMTGYTGATTLTAGVLTLTDEASGDMVIAGGTLKGTSPLLGNVSMSSGAIAPGNSPGCFGTSDLTFTGGSYNVEIGGKTVCTEYDSTTVIGAVKLGSATTLNISVINGFEPAVDDVFAIITNDETDKTDGTFMDLADGAKVTVAGYTFEVHYNAGEDANDVVLRVTGTPSAPDTGSGSLISSPVVTVLSALAALGAIGGLKYADSKRK